MKLNKLTATIILFSFTIFSSCGTGHKTKENATNVDGIQMIETMANFNEIINSDTPVLVDFYADWCAPCKVMAPILEQVSKDMVGKVKVIKVNVDKNGDAARQYQIRSIPTLILFKNGKSVWQGVGVMQADKIKEVVAKNS